MIVEAVDNGGPHSARFVEVDEAKVLVVANDALASDQISSLIVGINGCRVSQVRVPVPSSIERIVSESDAATIVVHDAIASHCDAIRELLFQSNQPYGIPVVVISERDQSARMTDWLRQGAKDCLLRSVDLPRLPRIVDTLTFPVRNGCRRRSNWLMPEGLPPFCMACPESRAVIEQVFRVTNRCDNVLITGETGTGKTHLAKLIHGLSKRKDHPFIVINCAALPETLIESQLFGHVKGTFTGADADHRGAFAQVGEGTLLLDEIEALSLASQAKLLHAVEERSFAALGAYETQEFKGRLVVATNQCLDALVLQQKFRSDLYYRLDVLQVDIPALRDRRPDIRHLSQRYLAESARRNDSNCDQISDSTMPLLQSYDWPGNVRQLQNTIEQAAAATTAHELRPEDLPDMFRKESRAPIGSRGFVAMPDSDTTRQAGRITGHPLQDARSDGETQLLSDTLKANNNNRTATAAQLGISRTALYKRMRRLGLS